jgi:hypothetical protein
MARNEKICITLKHGMHNEVRVLCKEAGIKYEDAYITGMANWIDEMKSAGARYRPIYQADHMALERILRAGDERAVSILRSLMEMFDPAAQEAKPAA